MANPHHKGQGEGIERYPEYRAHKYLHGNRHDPWVPNDDFFPWFPSASTPDTFLFTLTSNMGAASGTADITRMDGTAVASNQTVINTLGDFSGLINGDDGICVLDNGVYYAIHPETAVSGTTAMHVFQLTGNLAPGTLTTASATVVKSGETGVIAGDTITVVNTGDREAFTGALGLAVKVSTQYWVIEVNQYATLSKATLTNDTHQFSAAAAPTYGESGDQLTIGINNWTSISAYPFSYIPALPPTTTITNPNNLIGLSGDEVVIIWNEFEGQFQLHQVNPAFKRRVKFQVVAEGTYVVPSAPNISALSLSPTEYTVIEPLEYDAGEVIDAAAMGTLQDPMNLLIGVRGGEVGIAEFSYETGDWYVSAFRNKPVELRVDGLNFDISHDLGNTWLTWHTGEQCPP